MRVAACALAVVCACGTGRALSVGQTARGQRAPDAAGFLILANGHGRGLIQWLSANYASSMLESYGEWAIFEPEGGELLADRRVYGALVRRIEAAAGRRDAIDIFIFAHTNDFVRILDDLPAPVRAKIRLVYNTGCENAAQHRQWLEGGARAYVGHPGMSCSEVFLYHFQPLWWSGMPLLEAVGEANYATHKSLLDPRDPLGAYCRRGGYRGEDAWGETAAQIAGDGAIAIDTRLGDVPPRNRARHAARRP